MSDQLGWIKIHRSILDWEWYKDINTKILFLHLLLKANHKEKKYQGFLIKRGQLLTGRSQLSNELGLTERQIRTSLTKLKTTSEVTIETNTKGSVITIVNYDSYQIVEDERPATSPQSDHGTTTNKNNKNIRNKEYSIFDSGGKLPPTPTKKSILDRKSDFKDLMIPYVNLYQKDTLNKFWEYWTEHGVNDRKMRFEKQKSFDVGRRLRVWFEKEKEYNQKNLSESPKKSVEEIALNVIRNKYGNIT